MILQCEAVTDIDVTAADRLRRLGIELHDAGVQLAFVELRSRLQELVSDYGLLDTLNRHRFYPSIEGAIAAAGEQR